MENNKSCEVDNAIIMAAGTASRLAPLSYECPKALLKVKGEVLIERQIKQLGEAGINEIVVVVGYQKERFYYLREKYGVLIVETSDFETRNNHASLYVVRKYMKNSYICCGDHYFIKNPFQKREDYSYYAVAFVEGKTDEWCVFADEKGVINQVITGGENAWIMRGQVFFSESFSRQMIPYLDAAYHDEASAQMFWEDIYVTHISEMDMHIKKYELAALWEFDSLEELREFDLKYRSDSGSSIMRNICEKLFCNEADIRGIVPIKSGAEAVGFRFHCGGAAYTYHYNTEMITSQESRRGERNNG